MYQFPASCRAARAHRPLQTSRTGAFPEAGAEICCPEPGLATPHASYYSRLIAVPPLNTQDPFHNSRNPDYRFSGVEASIWEAKPPLRLRADWEVISSGAWNPAQGAGRLGIVLHKPRSVDSQGTLGSRRVLPTQDPSRASASVRFARARGFRMTSTAPSARASRSSCSPAYPDRTTTGRPG
jgi:hypothetical protein